MVFINILARDLHHPTAEKPIKTKDMKKFLLFLGITGLFLLPTACKQHPKQWNHDERRAVRQALNEYRQMVYLEDLSESEFALFADGVAVDLENSYPVYAEFVELPGVEDTVEMVVVTSIVEELNADARNMRHLYPYDYLVAQGVLPTGLSRDQQRAFYQCFAQQVNTTFHSMGQFFNAILADTTNTSQIAQMESRCANELFGWEVVITEIVETDN